MKLTSRSPSGVKSTLTYIWVSTKSCKVVERSWLLCETQLSNQNLVCVPSPICLTTWHWKSLHILETTFQKCESKGWEVQVKLRYLFLPYFPINTLHHKSSDFLIRFQHIFMRNVSFILWGILVSKPPSFLCWQHLSQPTRGLTTLFKIFPHKASLYF